MTPDSPTYQSEVDRLARPAFIVNEQHCITACNASFARLPGLQPDEIKDQKCYRLVHGREEPEDKCPLLVDPLKRPPFHTEQIVDAQGKQKDLILLEVPDPTESTRRQYLHILFESTLCSLCVSDTSLPLSLDDLTAQANVSVSRKDLHQLANLITRISCVLDFVAPQLDDKEFTLTAYAGAQAANREALSIFKRLLCQVMPEQ